MTTPKLQMPELVVGQAGKELTHNQALAVLDQLAQAVVVDKDLTAPPGSPANGSMYIVAAGATGAWSGQSGKLAYWLTTVAAWTFIAPADGWSVWVTDEAVRYERKAGSWVVVATGGGGASLPAVQTFTGAKALSLSDINTYNVSQDATAQVVTLPAQETVAWTADAEIHVERGASGGVSITGADGVQINGAVAGTFTLGAQYSVVTLKRKASNLWTLFGVAVSAPPSGPPSVGAYWADEGGYYAGQITYSDSRSFHLVVASKDADVSAKPWGMTAYNGPAIGATSQFDGVFNTAAAVTSGLDVGTYPKEAFKHCENYVEGGKTDFYMAAQVEMAFIREALRPTKPGQVAAFATGGAQAFDNAIRYWTSTETGATTALAIRFDDADIFDFGKSDTGFRIRPVRRVAV